MQPLGIEAPDPETARGACDRLAAALEGRGRVAVVERAAVDSGGRTRYRVDEDGGWAAAGEGMDLRGALEALAPDHDYALVVGFPEADLPRIAVGTGADADALASFETPEAIDTEAVAAALDDTEPFETLESLVARAKRSADADRAGAIATFTGRVRERDRDDDEPTTHLEFEKYEGVAADRMRAIERELEARDGVFEVVMHHRTGVIEAGEDIVFVVVLAGHRPEAFETVSDGIDRLKDEVPIFKKEVTVEETFWVHERS